MVVQHNLSALNTNRMFGITTAKQAKSSEKLSSGYRINRAADDAAGLSISEKMRKQVRGLNRGADNTMDGISLCQVVDGALNEVIAMIQRVSELSVQSANGTNSASDREALQCEVDEILKEINRIGDTTKFNEIYPFRKNFVAPTGVQNATNPNDTEGNIPFDNIKLSDVNLGMNPFTANTDPNHLALQAVVDKADSVFDGKSYNLIFGNGSTSSSSFKLNYEDANGNNKTEVVNMSQLAVADYEYDANSKTWSRTFNYTNADGINISITQTVQADETSVADEKNYKIAYTFTNNVPNSEASVEFMFHTDTAYNNNDQCEGYFINGQRVENNCVYTTQGSPMTDGQTSTHIYEQADVPNSFSVVDVDEALAFSEKISFSGTGDSRPKSVSIGHYNEIDEWTYYDSLDSNLGADTNREDLGFSLYYTGEMDAQNNTTTFSFNYGIVATEKDQNLTGVAINKSNNNDPNNTSVMEEKGLWIQSGAEVGDGMHLTMRTMNSGVLGLSRIDISTEDGATAAIDVTSEALRLVTDHRGITGAQQNRLEHTYANTTNIAENTTAAESRIRDTDMAEEMVEFSINNILAQAGQSMLAQANQSTQGVLSLLQ